MKNMIFLVEMTELMNGNRVIREINEQEYIIALVDEEVVMFSRLCPHMQQPLENASIKNGAVQCPLHPIHYCLKSGVGQISRSEKKWKDRLRIIPVVVRDHKVYLSQILA